MDQGKLITKITAAIGGLTLLIAGINEGLGKIQAMMDGKVSAAIEVREPGPMPPDAEEMAYKLRVHRLEDRVDSLEVEVGRLR